MSITGPQRIFQLGPLGEAASHVQRLNQQIGAKKGFTAASAHNSRIQTVLCAPMDPEIVVFLNHLVVLIAAMETLKIISPVAGIAEKVCKLMEQRVWIVRQEHHTKVAECALAVLQVNTPAPLLL